jgi:hypothetical protein
MGPPPLGPPPKRSGSGPLIAIFAGGGLVLLILIVVVVVVVSSSGDKMTPTERLNAAASSLSSARAMTFKGSFGTGINGELKVTKGGRALGEVTSDGSSVTVLSIDDKLYVKADRSYWQREISSLNDPYFIGSGAQWGKVDSTDVDLGFKRKLTPTSLAAEMRQNTAYRLTQTNTTVGGRKAVRVGSSLATFYVTDSDSPELLRYESTYPRVSADVTVQSGSTASATVSEIRDTVGELKDSFDSTARASVVSPLNSNRCTIDSSSCTVRKQIRPPLGTTSSTTIEVRYTIKAGSSAGRDLGSCTTKVTVSSSSPVWASCRVSTSAWRSWASSATTSSRYLVEDAFKVPGASDSDIRAMQSALDSE